MKYLLLLLFVPLISCGPTRRSTSLLDQVLSTVEKGLKFFSLDYSDINVDGLFGLRLGQGQLIEATNECKYNPRCTDELLDTLQSLEKQLADTCDKALPYVEQDNEAYYERFKGTIDRPYLLPYTPTYFAEQDLIKMKIGTESRYNEDKGDACYARVMGTYKENGRLLPKCNVTSDCLDYMTSGGTARYSLTHQLLYFIVVQNVGCTKAVRSFTEGSGIFEVQKRFCSNIYTEARNMVTNGNVYYTSRDLFLEQSVLCGPLGFEDFMRQDWMKMVLQWPDKTDGCFKPTLHQELLEADTAIKVIATAAGITDPNVIKKYEENAEKEAEKKYEQDNDDLIINQAATMRKLLREKNMKDNCLSHTSGLGFGTFATYLRFLVRYM